MIVLTIQNQTYKHYVLVVTDKRQPVKIHILKRFFHGIRIRTDVHKTKNERTINSLTAQ